MDQILGNLAHDRLAQRLWHCETQQAKESRGSDDDQPVEAARTLRFAKLSDNFAREYLCPVLARTAPAVGGMSRTRASPALRRRRTVENAARAIRREIAVVQAGFRIGQVTGGLEGATTPHIVKIRFALVCHDDARKRCLDHGFRISQQTTGAQPDEYARLPGQSVTRCHQLRRRSASVSKYAGSQAPACSSSVPRGTATAMRSSAQAGSGTRPVA